MPASPKVIALVHSTVPPNPFDIIYSSMAHDYLEEVASENKKRRLFIEGPSAVIEAKIDRIKKIRHQSNGGDYFVRDFSVNPQDPFEVALAEAIANKWEIIPMDKESHLKIYSKTWQNDPMRISKTTRYVTMNLRERQWAATIKRLNAGKDDIVILHPDHVKGFLKMSGISKDNVTWLSHPERTMKRINFIEHYFLKKARLKARKQRNPKAFEYPKQFTFDFYKSAKYWKPKKH